MTDGMQIAAVVDRLIDGQDTTFDAEDARTLGRLLPEEARTGFGTPDVAAAHRPSCRQPRRPVIPRAAA